MKQVSGVDESAMRDLERWFRRLALVGIVLLFAIVMHLLSLYLTWLSRFNTVIFAFSAISLLSGGVMAWRLGRGIAAAMRESVRARLLLEKANQDLTEMKTALESRMAERTASLISANDALQKEILIRNEAEGRAREAGKAAVEASAAKSRFLARMSHELRTPLNGIIGMTELALALDLPEKAKKFLSLARSSADGLLSVVNDLLDFSKLESGDVVLCPSAFRLRQLMAEVCDGVRPQADEKGILLVSGIDSAVPDDLVSDAARLRQVLSHLLRNAVGHIGRGEVRLQVTVMGDAPGGALVIRFSVSDNGPGIPPEMRANIIDAFGKAGSVSGGTYAGAALGLCLTAELVALMGGRIWLEEDAGPGTEVCFSVAMSRPAAGENCVLVVDDDFVNRTLIVTMIETAGWRAKEAADGREALELIRGGGYPLVLMDLEMPEIDGLRATAAIREIEQEQGWRRTIVAITAYDDEEDRRRCLAAGMDEFLPKPIVAAKLDALLRRLLPR